MDSSVNAVGPSKRSFDQYAQETSEVSQQERPRPRVMEFPRLQHNPLSDVPPPAQPNQAGVPQFIVAPPACAALPPELIRCIARFASLESFGAMRCASRGWNASLAPGADLGRWSRRVNFREPGAWKFLQRLAKTTPAIGISSAGFQAQCERLGRLKPELEIEPNYDDERPLTLGSALLKDLCDAVAAAQTPLQETPEAQ